MPGSAFPSLLLPATSHFTSQQGSNVQQQNLKEDNMPKKISLAENMWCGSDFLFSSFAVAELAEYADMC